MSFSVIGVDDDEADFGLVQGRVASGVDDAVVLIERVVDALLQTEYRVVLMIE